MQPSWTPAGLSVPLPMGCGVMLAGASASLAADSVVWDVGGGNRSPGLEIAR